MRTYQYTAGELLQEVYTRLDNYVKAGISTDVLDYVIDRIVRELGGIPSTIGYRGYNHASCLSVNDMVAHGVPSPHIILKDGDIIKVDIVVNYRGWNADACRTYVIGENEEANKLKLFSESLTSHIIAHIRPGITVGELATIALTHCHATPYQIVKELGGHGIGLQIHENPLINHTDTTDTTILKLNDYITIEPIVVKGMYKLKLLADKWTIVNQCGNISAQTEDTVHIVENGVRYLTRG